MYIPSGEEGLILRASLRLEAPMAFHGERKQQRLPGFDYSTSGYYFVTTCTYNRRNWFGNVINGTMVLSEYGTIVAEQWKWLERQYCYVTIDEWIVMPDHLHGIVVIHKVDLVVDGRDRPQPRKIKSLFDLIGAFKTTSSKRIHLSGLTNFRWQRSFYDHIIRDEKSLDKIREYILSNPISWEVKRNNSKNVPLELILN